MNPSDDFNADPALEYDEWRVLLRSVCGRYSPEGVEPKGFAGSIRRDIRVRSGRSQLQRPPRRTNAA
jgi:hypothetical protein